MANRSGFEFKDVKIKGAERFFQIFTKPVLGLSQVKILNFREPTYQLRNAFESVGNYRALLTIVQKELCRESQ